MVSTRIPSRLVVVIVAAVSWFAVGCSESNTVTGPRAMATPIPATATPIPTPTPIPGAVLKGHLTAARPSGLVPVNLAKVSVRQGSRIFEATSNPDGFYVVFGLEAGVASVTAFGLAPGGYYSVWGAATITLQKGSNELNMQLR